MPKITCPNCGHKNKSSTMICSECGNYLGDTTASNEQRLTMPTQEPAPEPETEPAVAEPVQGQEAEKKPSPDSGDTIGIETRASMYRFFPMIVYAGLLAVYLIAIQFHSISLYYFIPIILVLFIAPQIARALFFPVKFNATGFNFRHDGDYKEFQYSDIARAVVKVPQRGIQMVTLDMDNKGRNVTLDFDQMLTLRQFLNQLQRRRIPISIDRENPVRTA